MGDNYNVNFHLEADGITDGNWNTLTASPAGSKAIVDDSLNDNGVALEVQSGFLATTIRSDVSDELHGIPAVCWNTPNWRGLSGEVTIRITGLAPNTDFFLFMFGTVGTPATWRINGHDSTIPTQADYSNPAAPTEVSGIVDSEGGITLILQDDAQDPNAIRGINGFTLRAESASVGGGPDTGVGGFPIRESYSGEPISILTVDQDTCLLNWGEGACTAGLYNIVHDNQNYDNSALWDLNDWSYAGPPAHRPEFTKTAVTASGNLIESAVYLIYPPDVDIYYSVDVTSFSGGVDEFRLRVQTIAGYSDVVVNLTNGSFVNGSSDNAFDNVTVVPSSVPNYYRLEAKVLAVNMVDLGGIAFEFLTAGSVPAVGDKGRTYGLQAAAKAGQEAILTSGIPRFAQSTKPCFNTRGTCQDPDNYTLDVLPLNFVKPRSSALRDDYYIPSLNNVSIGAAKLNPGGANRSASAFGQRATISATFKDHPHNDLLVDKYRDQRDYDPLEQGSFWSKWRARNPYYMHRFVTLKTGYIEDGVLVGAVERSFVMTGFSGPDSAGNVAIKGKDILTIAEDAKSQAPFVSTGRLSAAILAGDGSATLAPAGIGDLEYPASGTMRIEREVMTFTRVADALTLTSRGIEGTDAADHDVDSSVQLCLVYTSQKPQDILYDLLLNYAGIPDVYLDKAGWDAEQLDYMPHLYTTIIAEPEGVGALISEMCQQMYFSVWWDERVNLVKIRAVRSAQDDPVYDLTDDKNFIKDSVKWKDLSNELITQVWVYYGQIDPTEKLDKASNYAALEASIDLSVEDATKQGIKKVKRIYSRWINQLDAGAAVALGGGILDRYANIPREVSFKVDAKDGAIWLGDFAQVTNRLQVDQFGAPQTTNIQIYEAEESAAGSVFSYTGQQFIGRIEGGEGGEGGEEPLILAADTLNVNLRTWYESQRGVPVGDENITFIIRSGVTVGGDTAGGGVNVLLQDRTSANDVYDAGTSALYGYTVGDVNILQRSGIATTRTTTQNSVYAGGPNTANFEIREYPLSTSLTTGDWSDVPSVTLNLVIEPSANIVGEGGNGSSHSFKEIYPENDSFITVTGGDGGHAIEILHAINITNGGVIGGGGGGGGCLFFESTSSNPDFRKISGGGGGGLNFSSVTSNIYSHELLNIITETQPSGGSIISSGYGGKIFSSYNGGSIHVNFYFNSYLGYESASGDGGDIAINGESVTTVIENINAPSFDVYERGTGGQAGDAIKSGSSLITWVNKGDVRGDENA